MHLSIDTALPADSVEFCPHPDALNIFVCGTYQLQDQSSDSITSPPSGSAGQTQTRTGQCLVYEVDSDQEIGVSKIQEISLPAVLDLKWCHTTPSRRPLVAVAGAEGCVDLFEWELEQKQLRHASSLRVAPSHVLCLSLDWSNRRAPTSTMGSLVASLSDGTLTLLEPDQTGQLAISSAWAAHAHEPWCVAWNYYDTNVIYSGAGVYYASFKSVPSDILSQGGDDLQLKVWDIRQGFEQPIITNKRYVTHNAYLRSSFERVFRFDAGVTCIQSHPNLEHLIAVGSYDATVRIFDTRKLLKPLSQADVGGGAWRVKWHPSPSRCLDLLVAAMHDGFKIMRFYASDANSGNWEILKKHNEHKSLAYGVDWSYKSSQDHGESLIASASFYDHALHLWRG